MRQCEGLQGTSDTILLVELWRAVEIRGWKTVIGSQEGDWGSSTTKEVPSSRYICQMLSHV